MGNALHIAKLRIGKCKKMNTKQEQYCLIFCMLQTPENLNIMEQNFKACTITLIFTLLFCSPFQLPLFTFLLLMSFKILFRILCKDRFLDVLNNENAVQNKVM